MPPILKIQTLSAPMRMQLRSGNLIKCSSKTDVHNLGFCEAQPFSPSSLKKYNHKC